MPQVYKNPEAEKFYSHALKQLTDIGLPFMIGGAFALMQYTGITRDTKDLDIFATAGDYPKILSQLQKDGYKTEITDARWIAKAFKNEYFIDIIFSQVSGISAVDSTWFEHAQEMTFLNSKVKVLPAEELIWSKAFVMNRDRYDGADINHIFLKKGKELDWKRLMTRMEPHWEILLSHILNYRFVYPSKRNYIPEWIMNELLDRSKQQLSLPTPQDDVCRGPLLSRTQYEIDTRDWGFQDIK